MIRKYKNSLYCIVVALGSATSSLCQVLLWNCCHWTAEIWLWKSHFGALNNTLTALENAPPSCFSYAQKFPSYKNTSKVSETLPHELVTLMETFVCSLIWIHITENIAASNFSNRAEPALF